MRATVPARMLTSTNMSGGDGAAAAIDILSREKGDNVTDWDSPPEK